MKKILFALVLGLSMSAVFAAEDPVQAIRKKDTELQVLLKKKTTTAKEQEKIENLLNDSFDFKALAKKSLPSKVCNKEPRSISINS